MTQTDCHFIKLIKAADLHLHGDKALAKPLVSRQLYQPREISGDQTAASTNADRDQQLP